MGEGEEEGGREKRWGELRGEEEGTGTPKEKKASLVSNHFAVPGSTRTLALIAVSALY